MTSIERRRLLAYIEQVRDQLRLHEWDLAISSQPATESNSILEIDVLRLRHSGQVRIGSFFDETPGEQRQAVVHELVHIAQAGLIAFIEPDGGGYDTLVPAGLKWIVARVHEETEVQADWVARLLAPRVPLPPKFRR